MRVIKLNRNIIFLSVIVLLVVALTASVTVIVRKNNYIDDIKSQISDNEALIDKQSKREAELKKQLESSQKESANIKSQLDAVQKEKSQLQQENNKLKQEIAQLKNDKQAAYQAAVEAASKQQKNPMAYKVCYLTFDDGPSENTLEILKILEKYNAKATFFVINTSKIDYVKNIHNAGHTVGLHSYTHKYNEIYASQAAYFSDLEKISKAVESRIGVKSTIIRFPGGSSNSVSKNGFMKDLVKQVALKGYSYFDWNVVSGDADANVVSYTQIRNNVLNGAKNKNSICVLFHDAQNKTTTVTALPEILEGLIAQGYSFEALKPDSYGYHHVKIG